MIKIENVDTYGWEAAIRGLRNPKNSWNKSDTVFCGQLSPEIGENDLKLMKALAAAGNDHGKFMRMIGVSMDIVAPLFWVSEHDTYKVGTVRNSCSFMHRGTAKPFEIRDFSLSDERVYDVLSPLPNGSLHCKYINWKNGSKKEIPLNAYDNENYELFVLCDAWEKTIDLLNSLRKEYLDTKDEAIFQMIRQMLPCGYNVRYTWSANYAVLRNIYHSRKNHRLPEWRTFCQWIETLPYSELITG